MPRRITILALPLMLLAVASFAGPSFTFADEGKGDAAKVDAPKQDGKDGAKAEHPKSDNKTEGPRREGGPRGDGEGRWRGEYRGDGPRPPSSNPFQSFTADELKAIIAAVKEKDKKLADKLEERIAELARSRGPGPGPGTPPQAPKLTPEQVAKAIAVFEDRSPEFAARLKETLKENPDRLNAILAMQWDRLRKSIELKETDLELYKAQTEEIRRDEANWGLMRKLRTAFRDKNEAEVKSLQEQLRLAILEKQKAENAVRKLDIVRLQQRIVKLNEQIADDEKNMEQHAAKSLERIMEWIKSPPRPEPGKGEPKVEVKKDEK